MPEDIPVRVALRCRPLVPKERAEGCQSCLAFVPDEPQVVLGKNKAFTYDFAFGPDTAQGLVYTAVAPLVQGIFKGYNATVLAYGQTGSGKTYSMGSGYNLTDPDTMGIIPRVIRSLFSGIDERPETEFLLKCTYLEIHKEDINDLLNTSLKKETLSVREDPNGGIRVAGLQEVVVRSASELEQCLEQGSVGRTTGCTAMNAHSSRSHAIFTIGVEMRQRGDRDNYCHAKFHLVDLAGSERVKKTHAQGERLREGININRGLLALGNVISALGDENSRKGHIPYRDSKLTRLLQDSLGGNSQTLMLACVSPADSNMEETLNTLRYADRARQIKNKPVVNRDPQAAELARLRQQVQQLQVQLLQSKSIHGGPLADGPNAMQGAADLKTLLDRNQTLEAANQKLTVELQSAIDQTTHMCEKAILAEMARDKLRQRLEQLKEEADVSLGGLDVTLGPVDSEKMAEQLGAVRQLQQKISALETEDKQPSAVETLYETDAGDKEPNHKGESSAESTASPSPTLDVTGHTLRQAQLGRELQELNTALAMKQELAQAMGKNDEKMAVMKIHYENNVRDLENEIAALQKEREDLSSALHVAKTNTTSNKVSEQRRVRLQELSQEIGKLKKRLTEQSKLLKLKDKSDQTVSKLNKEIQSMKQTRVRLMKQMKEEGDKFRQWKAQKDKEVLQLKAKDRKRQCEFSKMTRRHEKQETVLRRKMEEAAAANKRLKEALEKQKSVRQKGPADKTEEKTLVGAAKRIKSWLDHELEVMVSVNEAKRHLASLLADRKLLSQQLQQLRQECENQPPTKKFASPNKAVNVQSPAAAQRISDLESELELRNAQISDLQQKIVDADQEEKGKNRWNEITSMVEAKCGLKWLLETCVAAKVSTGVAQSQLAELEDSNQEVLADVQQLRDQLAEVKAGHAKEVTAMQRTHEDKVLYLLTQLSQARQQNGATTPSAENEDDLKQRVKFQEEQIRELSTLHEQLQETTMENEELHQRLTVASYSSRKQSLMPTLVSPASSPDTTPLKVPKKRSFKQKKTPMQRYTLAEYFAESETETESEMDLDSNDPEWHLTPFARRGGRQKRSAATANESKKRSLDKSGCGCRGFCKSRLCSCVKGEQACTESCRCETAKCQNRQDVKNTNDTVSSTTSSVLMNTTIVLSDSDEDQNSTAVASAASLPSATAARSGAGSRRPLSQLTGNLSGSRLGKNNSHHHHRNSSGSGSEHSDAKPALKAGKGTANPYLGPGGGIGERENDGSSSGGGGGAGAPLRRKRKLLSTAGQGSFFKPLLDS